MEKMIKIEIELDEEKILADNKYSPDELMSVIDEIFGRDGYPILEAGRCRRVYRDKGDISHDFGGLGFDTTHLARYKWFPRYAKKVLWIDSIHAEYDGDWNVEDFIASMKKVGVGYYA